MDNILAIHGGKPIRENQIRYGKQYIDEDDLKAVNDTLLSDYITSGPQVENLEQKLCELTGAKYAVAVSNGTAALHVACLAAGIQAGDEVITTPMTFVASANCALYCGAKPVFADIDRETYNISPASISEKITEKTKAVVAVDFTGQSAELDEIKEICKEKHIILMEDAAHAIGTKYKGVPIGNISDMTTFSFHPVKTVTGGEGGAILTNDKNLYEKLYMMRSHAITRNLEFMENPSDAYWYYEQVGLGYNYRMTDFQAALVSSQLNKLNRFSTKRKEIVNKYNEAFKGMPEIRLQREIKESDTTRHLYILQLNLEKLNADRRMIFDAMKAENVCPQVHYIPVYYHPYYQKLGYRKGLCPNAEWLYERILTIPLYYSLSDNDIDDVIQCVKKVIGFYRK